MKYAVFYKYPTVFYKYLLKLIFRNTGISINTPYIPFSGNFTMQFEVLLIYRFYVVTCGPGVTCATYTWVFYRISQLWEDKLIS